MITDMNYLQTMSGGDHDLINEMINIFKVQVNEFSQDFHKHLEQENYIDLGKLAHKAKSSVAIMGMNDLSKKLKELELLTKNGKKTEKYQEYIEYFNAECKLALKELEEYQKSLT